MEIVADLPLENGECPVWNPIDRRFYWADIPRGRMFAFEPATRECRFVHDAGSMIGVLLVSDDGSLVQGLQDGRVQRWENGKVSTVIDEIPQEKGRRFNDGIVDAHGRLLLGTMPGEGQPSRLYVVERDGSYRTLLDDLGESNGMAFTKDGKTLYHTDTKAKTVTKYDYDPESASLGKAEVLIQVSSNGVPDGLEIDSQGNLWSAHWGEGRIVLYDPAGKALSEQRFPARNISSAAFGGLQMELLFVTSAGGQDRAQNGEKAGASFCFRPQVPGMRARLGFAS